MATPPNPMSCINWNCRGLGLPRAIHELNALIRSHNPLLIFLMETQLFSTKFMFLKSSLGFSNGFMVDRSGQGRGLIMLWKEELEVSLVSYSTGHIDLWVAHKLLEGGCFLTSFYGH